MSYDWQWAMPGEAWSQQGSFIGGATPPVDGPDGGTLVELGCINVEWVPLIVGCLAQLRNPSTWPGLSDAGLALVLSRVDLLRQMLTTLNPCCNVAMRLTSGCVLQYSTDGGATYTDVTDWVANFTTCVQEQMVPPAPYTPTPPNIPQDACNNAEWLAIEFQQLVMQKAAANVAAHNDVNNFIKDIATAFVALAPVLDLLMLAWDAFFSTAQDQATADLNAVSTDTTFWNSVKCAIYSATNGVGYVTFGNLPTVAANIAAISYPAHPWAPPMVANLFTHMGIVGVQAVQSQGHLVGADCSDCGGAWCHFFDFTLNNQGWTVWPGYGGTYNPGVGWEYVNQSGGYGDIDICFEMGTSHTLTELQVYYTMKHAVDPSSLPAADLDSACGGSTILVNHLSTTTIWPAYSWTSVTFAPTIAKAFDVYFRSGFTGSSGDLVIAGVQVRGTGPNPFGTDNCVVGP